MNKIISLFITIFITCNVYAKPLLIASTTSTDNSGLFNAILPIFTKDTGIKVNVLAQGTGQAINTAKNGDADVLFVHHKPSELDFIKQGFGIKRFNVMYNDFIIVGPKSDPLNIANCKKLQQAIQKFKSKKGIFISRGDNSGTHKKEQNLWKKFKVNTSKKWLLETGSSMGATLNIANAKNAYTIADRSTWLAFNNKNNLKIVFQNSKELFNQYGVIAVNNKIYPHIQIKKANIFIKWIISKKGQQAIQNFKINGEISFFPNAK